MQFARILYLLILISIFIPKASAQQVYKIQEGQPVLLDSGWNYIAGDDSANWQPIRPAQEIVDIPELKKQSSLQLKLDFRIESGAGNSTVLAVEQGGASRIYLDGDLLASFGYDRSKPGKFEGFNPMNEPIFLPQLDTGWHQIKVSYQIPDGVNFRPLINSTFPLFRAKLLTRDDAIWLFANNGSVGLSYFKIGICLILFLVHFIGFLFYPKARLQLYFSLYALFGCIGFFVLLQQSYTNLVVQKIWIDRIFLITAFFSSSFLLLSYFNLLKVNRSFWMWIFFALYIISGINGLAGNGLWRVILDFITSLSIPLITAFLAYREMKRGDPAARYIFAGSIAYFIFWILFLGSYQVPTPPLLKDILFHMAVFTFPISISMVISQNFMFINKDLERKIDEVKQLSLEKQELLALQNVQLEKLVDERTHALSQSLENLKATQAQLIQSEKMASLGELTAGIAHEIQNPLNFVNNFSEINGDLISELKIELDNGNFDEAKDIATDIASNEEKINHHGKRADAIVKAMLQHSRSSSTSKEPVNINALSDEYLRLAYHGLRAKDKSFNAAMKTDFDQHLGKVNVIPQDIGRVLLNIINNAFYAVQAKASAYAKASADGSAKAGANYEPTVSISTAKLNDAVEVRVNDNGNGIPRKVLDKIFQPFFTTKPTGEGTGLGLSLAYDIMKAHGGNINVETVEGEGTTFIISLPVN